MITKKKNSTNIEENNNITIADTVISSIGEDIYKELAVEQPAGSSEYNTIDEQNSPDDETDNNAAVLFEIRQRQYLKGRRATKTISDSSGNVIISEGMVIDDQVIDEAKLQGKLIELVMNNRA